MKNAEGKPICGADTTPLDPRTWRPKRVWSRSHCRRVVRREGDRCYQHQPPPPEGASDLQGMDAMRVKQLVEFLQGCNPTGYVYVYTDDRGRVDVEDVTYTDNEITIWTTEPQEGADW